MNQVTYPSRNQATTGQEVRSQSWVFQEETQKDEFHKFIRFLKKRGWLILASVALGIAIAMVVNVVKVRMYSASAEVEIVTDQSSQFRLEAAPGITATGDDAERLDTEMQILKSRSLALETIKSLHLESNPAFHPLNNGRPWDLSNLAARNALIGTFERGLQVGRNGQTRIITIKMTTLQPEMSALIANTLIDNYVEHSFRDNYSSTVKVSNWLSAQLNGLKEDLAKSETQMLEYQKSLGLFGIAGGNSSQSQSQGAGGDNVLLVHLNEINRSLADAEIDRILKQAQLNAMRSSSPGVIDAAVGLTNPGLQVSKQMLSELSAQYVSMSQSYGPEYPPLKTLKAQIMDAQKNLENQEADVLTTAQKEYDAASAKEAMIRHSLEADEESAFSKAQDGAQFEIARENYEAKRRIYDGLQERLLEAGILAGLRSSSIHLVDSAEPPVFPSSPRKNVNLALGFGIGMLFGCGVGVILEGLDTTLKDMAEIEEALQLPLLASIPVANFEQMTPKTFKDQALAKEGSSWSEVTEALRSLRTSILLSRPGSPPKVIMVTSARPAEGKSTMATLLSITFALGGSRVLVIDADLRRPTLHRRFDSPNGRGLSSVLTGEASIQDVVTPWKELPNLHILAAGPVPPLASELLGSKQMAEMLKELRDEYDYILIDSPPILAVTDAAIIGQLADATILVIRYGTARKQVEQRCIDVLDRSGAHLLGAVVNVVNFNSPGYSEYYGKRYYNYYSQSRSE